MYNEAGLVPTDKQMKKMLKSQQAELNAVTMYLKLAEVVKDEEIKPILKEVAADEGRHASILHAYTKVKLVPEDKLANILVNTYRILGQKCSFRLIAIGEKIGAKSYVDLVEAFPELASMQGDELKHQGIFNTLAKKKRVR